MRRLVGPSLSEAYALYLTHDAFFPLIGEVLQGRQDGAAHASGPGGPMRVYVEHAFGFAQVFGAEDSAFDADLKRYLTVKKAFQAPKARLYTPCEPDFLKSSAFDGSRSQRQRFELDVGSREFAAARDALKAASIEVRAAAATEIDRIESCFGAVGRFWRRPEDFVAQARAVVAWRTGRPVALCFAAAVANRRAEIDVLTAPEHRRSGFGRLVVQAFNQRCLGEDLIPIWDCFTNNQGSIALSRAVGFKPRGAPYPFYTFNR